MEKFKLEEREWELVDPIAEGKFGQVWVATDGRSGRYAAKLIPKDERALRELNIADLESAPNVVPVVDKGEHGDKYVLVMPLAERTLRERMDQVGRPDTDEILAILTDIATGLEGLADKIVHRDLKPENVLLLDGSWHVADFGISKYAETSTETGLTHKFSMTPAYAAPEQWRGETATTAADVYAFGVMAFELFEGKKPFRLNTDTLRAAHLGTLPPSMSVGSALESLVHECLAKNPGARPTSANLVTRLARAKRRTELPGWEIVMTAELAERRRQATADLAETRAQEEYDRRAELYKTATAQWVQLEEGFRDAIDEFLPSAIIKPKVGGAWHAELNGAVFSFSYASFISEPTPQLPFDVIGVGGLGVQNSRDANTGKRWRGRGHGLYFADAFAEGSFKWVETSFMHTDERNRDDPHMEPISQTDLEDIGLQAAFNDVQGRLQVVWPPTPLDFGDWDEFIQRWLTWFAEASMGRLKRPAQLPERLTRTWRG